MKKPERVLHSKWIGGLIILSLSMLGAIGIPAVASALGPGTVCVLQIEATDAVLAILVDQPTNFSTAVLVPEESDTKVNVPVTCESLETLALAVANQKNKRVTFTMRVFTSQGELVCSSDPLDVPKRGARGALLSSCQ